MMQRHNWIKYENTIQWMKLNKTWNEIDTHIDSNSNIVQEEI